MKKEFKRALSKILAGTMLITSSFAGTVVANAETSEEVIFNYTFDSETEKGIVGTDTSANYYMNKSILLDNDNSKVGKAKKNDGTEIDIPATSKSGTDITIDENGPVHAYYNVKSGSDKYIRVADFNSANPELFFNIPEKATNATSGKLIIESKVVVEATGTNMTPFKINLGGDGTSTTKMIGFGSGSDKTKALMIIDSDKTSTKTVSFDTNWKALKFTIDLDAKKVSATCDGTDLGEVAITNTQVKSLSIYGSGATNRCMGVDDVKVTLVTEKGNTPVEPDEPTTSPAAFTLTSDNINITATGGAITEVTGADVVSFNAENQIITVTGSALTADGIANAIKALDNVENAAAEGEKVTVNIKGVTEPIVFYVKKQIEIPADVDLSFDFKDGENIEIAVSSAGAITKIEGSSVESANIATGEIVLKYNNTLDVNGLYNKMSAFFPEGGKFTIQNKTEGLVITNTDAADWSLVLKVSVAPAPVEKADGFTYADGTKISIVAENGAITSITGDDVVADKTTNAKVTLTKDSTLTAASIASGIDALDKVTATEASGVITITTEKGTQITLTVEKESGTVTPPEGGDLTVGDKDTINVSGTAGDKVTADTTKPVYATAADIAEYTAKGIKVTAPASGNGKLIFDFGGKAKTGVLKFETTINVNQADFGTVELQGKSAGREGDLIVVNNNGGFYQFAVRTGGENNQFVSDTAVITGTDVTIRIEVDLVNKTAKAFVNDVQLKNADGDISLAAASTVAEIEYIDKAAYFVKNGASQEVSAAKYEIAEASTVVPSDSGTITIEKTAVGTANLDALKPGDQVDVTYKLSDKVVGINNYTFFIDFDPTVLDLLGAQEVPADQVVGYLQSGLSGIQPLIPVELINGMGQDKGQMDIVPAADNADYANCKVKPDGVKTAKELGRIKLAGVAGLAGYNEANTSEKTPWATTTSGILFTVRFQVKEGANDGFGSFPEIGLTPVGSTAGKYDLFFGVPKDGTGSDVIKVDETNSKVDEVVEIPGTSDLFDFSYVNDTLGVKIVVANGVLDTDFGTSVKDFSKGVMTLTKESDTTVAQVIADMLTAGKVTGATVAADGEDGVILTSTTDTTKTMSIKFAKEQKEPDPIIPTPEPLDFSFTDATLGVSFTVENGAIVGTTFGDNIKENTGTPTAPVLVIKEGAPETVTPEAIINAIVGANLGEGVTATAGTGSVTIKNEDGSSITIKFAKEGEPPVGDTTFEIKITDAAGNEAVDLTAVVDGNGLNVTTGTGKGPVKKTDDGAIAPVITKVVDTDPTNNVDTTALATENFTVKGAKSFNYDVDTMTLNLVDAADKTYKLQLYVGGDFNDDGTAGVSDALKIIAFANENPSIVAETTDRNKVAGDVNLDEDLGLSDALQIVAFANEKLAEFPMFTE